MNSVKFSAFLAGASVAILVATPSLAGSLAEQFVSCANKFAVRTASSVMLDCTAADGKLTDCKVVTADGATGADKAALCVAEALPVGSKTGAIKVPIKFDPSK